MALTGIFTVITARAISTVGVPATEEVVVDIDEA